MFNFTIGHGDGYCYAFLMLDDDKGGVFSWSAIFNNYDGSVTGSCDALPF